jgi:hypothetical protein
MKNYFSNLLIWKFDFKLSLFLILSFILFTAIGAVSHEMGHWIVAEVIGIDAKVNYYSTSFIGQSNDRTRLLKMEDLAIYIGGPLQTMLVGSFWFLCLWKNRFLLYKEEKLDFKDWFFVLLALFWLRELANFVM